MREVQKNINKIANENSEALIENFDFNPKKYLDTSLTFNIKKMSEEQTMNKIIKSLPNKNECYIQHRDGMDTFTLRKDRSQQEKEDLYKTLLNIE